MAQVVQTTKNEGLAALLSFFIPGAGQIYAGRVGRGLGVLLGLFVVILLWLGLVAAAPVFSVVIFLPFAFWLWNVYDANNACKEYNAQLTEDSGHGLSQPEIIETPSEKVKDEANELLKLRYVKGEIDKEEYQEKKKVLDEA